MSRFVFALLNCTLTIFITPKMSSDSLFYNGKQITNRIYRTKTEPKPTHSFHGDAHTEIEWEKIRKRITPIKYEIFQCWWVCVCTHLAKVFADWRWHLQYIFIYCSFTAQAKQSNTDTKRKRVNWATEAIELFDVPMCHKRNEDCQSSSIYNRNASNK